MRFITRRHAPRAYIIADWKTGKLLALNISRGAAEKYRLLDKYGGLVFTDDTEGRNAVYNFGN